MKQNMKKKTVNKNRECGMENVFVNVKAKTVSTAYDQTGSHEMYIYVLWTEMQ